MFSSLRDGGPAELPAVLCSPVILKPPSALTHTVGTMPWAPMWPTVTGTHLLSKGPILETIFWVCLFICFFCPPCWEWWQGSFLVDIVNSALKVTFPTEKQLFRVWIFKRISPKKKSGCISWKVILLNLDLGICGSLSLIFIRNMMLLSVWKRK